MPKKHRDKPDDTHAVDKGWIRPPSDPGSPPIPPEPQPEPAVEKPKPEPEQPGPDYRGLF